MELDSVATSTTSINTNIDNYDEYRAPAVLKALKNGDLDAEQSNIEGKEPERPIFFLGLPFPQEAEEVLRIAKKVLKIVIFVAYHIWFVWAIWRHVDQELPIEWCAGLGFIIILTALTYFVYALKFFIVQMRKIIPEKAKLKCLKIIDVVGSKLSNKWIQYGIYVACAIGAVVYMAVQAVDPEQYISIVGIFAFLFGGVVVSTHPKRINWRIVFGGTAMQFLFAMIIINVQLGRDFVNCLADKVTGFMSYTAYGSVFFYDWLVTRQPFILNKLANDSYAYEFAKEINENRAMSSIPLGFGAFSVVCYFTFFINVLFHFGLIQKVCNWTAVLFTYTVGTTVPESANAAANIFLGQALAPLVVRQYIPHVTKSEAHSMLASGFASIAGVSMAIYISYGVSANDLLAASVMSAPAALCYAKILYPEVETPKNWEKEEKEDSRKHFGNFWNAGLAAASESAITLINIAAVVTGMIAFMAFANAMVAYFGALIGLDLSFEVILGKLFMPVAFMMGIPWDECETVGQLLAIKCILNEFIAYYRLGLIRKAATLSPRTITIVTYAMCGSANPGFMGMSVAIFRGICPERAPDFTAVLFRSFASGIIACFITACIAGALISG